ncbi:unnamed protein product [Schistosoma margrebowiei]|uniref:Uncharacterized protein n=1 Tax=Schistosoma margrebowiei TaxID=48269 RepID=A0A183MJ86_9TREM|nr:unnamed protein product [Schistosoma margrebowiei]
MSASERKCGIQWTDRMQLDDLDFTNDLALLLHMQQQILEKTTSVAAVSASGSIIDEQGGSDADEKARISKTTATVCQSTSKSQYKYQNSSTVWGGNLESYENHHTEDTGVY